MIFVVVKRLKLDMLDIVNSKLKYNDTQKCFFFKLQIFILTEIHVLQGQHNEYSSIQKIICQVICNYYVCLTRCKRLVMKRLLNLLTPE